MRPERSLGCADPGCLAPTRDPSSSAVVEISREQRKRDPLPAPALRLADWLNPILVRELQQSLKGRAFACTMVTSLCSVVVIAVVVAANYQAGSATGRSAFEATLIVLVPILLLLVPMQAFHSMRLEMVQGTTELLLLSSLTPARIVAGKLMAAMAHFVLYVAVFAPLLALTFLLRGVDVPTIVVALGLCGLACLVTSMVGIAMGSLMRWRQVGSLVAIATVLALTGFAIRIMAAIPVIHRELLARVAAGSGVDVLCNILLSACGVIVFSFVLAQSQLTHENENRSSAFRVVAVATTVAVFAWRWIVAPGGGHRYLSAPAGSSSLVSMAAVAAASVVLCSPFFLFAATEEARLSRRTRAHVPGRRVRALLVAPFLPGGERGLLFTVLLLSATAAIGMIGSLDVRVPPHTYPAITCVVVALYVFFYVALGRLVRSWVRPGPGGTWLARTFIVLLLLCAYLLPRLLAVLAPSPPGLFVLHLLNPFTAIETLRVFRQGPGEAGAVPLMGALCLLLLLLTFRSMKSGVVEVLEAARRRRERAA